MTVNNLPYSEHYSKRTDAPYMEINYWPSKWIAVKSDAEPPFVSAYINKFYLECDDVIKIYVTADERYELFVDGIKVGRGSERGDKNNWYYETYNLDLKAGKHTISARVWSFGSMKPWAQQSIYHGFLLSPDNEKYMGILGTGVARWKAKILDGYSFIKPEVRFGRVLGSGATIVVDATRFSWGFENGDGDNWGDVISLDSGNNGILRNPTKNVHKMKPAILPQMREAFVKAGRVKCVINADLENTSKEPVNLSNSIENEVSDWQNLFKGGDLIFPSNTKRRVIIDLENYYCVYEKLLVSGGKGSEIKIGWSEALFLDDELQHNDYKGNRDEIDGKYFIGIYDEFLLDGSESREFDTLWWRTGRYIEILISSESEPIHINGIKLYETGYPLLLESSFKASDKRMEKFVPVAFRTLQICSHETYMDCPYYEQLMYIGDTRVEALVTYVATNDARLPKKALKTFDAAREGYSGLNSCAFPEEHGKIIPSFSLWWIAMVYDYALWRGDKEFISGLMPGIRSVMETILANKNQDGLIASLDGWDYIDWSQNKEEKWYFGIAPDEGYNVNSIFNFQVSYVLKLLSELEEFMGEPELSKRAERLSKEINIATTKAFWYEERGMFSDDILNKSFSEHAQCMAILSGELESSMSEKVFNALISEKNLAKTSIFYSHYLFEVLNIYGRDDLFHNKMNLWYELEKFGYKVLPEYLQIESRSDCHAWSSHPLYHFFTFVLGIKPNSMGFETVNISPRIGELNSASGKLIHPNGEIIVDYVKEVQRLVATIELPDNLYGNFCYNNQIAPLKPGKQVITLTH